MFKCIYCGRFISYNDLENDLAKSISWIDDYYFESEKEYFEAYHVKCKNKYEMSNLEHSQKL